MGLTVGKITGNSNGTITLELYNRDGSSAGTMTVSTSRTRTSKSNSTSKTNQKKYKKLQYNFKRLSNQILRTKTSTNAKQLVTKAKFQIANLRMKLISGDYDYTEIHNALLHAEKIARVAKKRMKNLEEEENIEKTGHKGMTEPEEMRTKKEEDEEFIDTIGMSQEEMKELVQQLQEEMEKIEDELEEAMKDTENLMEEFVQGSKAQLDPADLEQLKKKHRAEEMRDIMKADMEYLKAIFNKLAKEKESAGSSSFGSSNDSDNSCGNISGVSLEIGGVDVPVETAVQAPVEVAGASVDVTL